MTTYAIPVNVFGKMYRTIWGKNNMKICIIGSHSTGKTTLCNLLSKRYPDYFVIPEIARVFGIEKIVNKTIQIQKEMILTQINIEKYHNNFISDRSVLDCAVYAEDRDMLDVCYAYACTSYDHIFYVPVTFLPVDDGFRNIDREYQLHIASIFEKYLPKNTVLIKTKSNSSRIQEIISNLEPGMME